MFSVKATYRGEIRKFTFDLTSFPTFDQLITQLHLVFTSTTDHYLSKLLFCPDASHPSRILIAQQVHNADDYSKCLLPYKGRYWPNPLLRFDVLDEIPQRPANIVMIEQSKVPHSSDSSAESQSTPISSFFIPPPPIIFPAPRTHTTSEGKSTLIDAPNHNHPSELGSTTSSQRPRLSDSGCCSLAQSKSEIQGLIQSFQKDLDCMLNSTFGRSPPKFDATNFGQMNSSPYNGITSPVNNHLLQTPDSSSSCSLCSIRLVGHWYTCRDCLARVCFECNMFNRSNFCVVSLGPHLLQLTVPAGPLSNPSWGTPSPWTVHSHTPPETQHLSAAHQMLRNNPLQPSRSMNASPPIEPFIPPLRVSTPQINVGQPAQPTQPAPVLPLAPAHVNPPPPPPAIHQGVWCDVCSTTIEGVRHKCLDCPDYDLCTPCISSGALERHDRRHQFLDLTEPTRVVVHTMYQNDGNAAPAMHSATCDLCDSRIHGDRYKCTSCPDFDTCMPCFSITHEQHPKHSFVKLSNPESYIRRDTSRPVYHLATCDACNKTIYGIRYKCMHPSCPDFDLCAGCEALPILQHPDNHPMLKMRSNETVIPTVYRLGQTSALNPSGDLECLSSAPPLRRRGSLPDVSMLSDQSPVAAQDPLSQISHSSDTPAPDLMKSLEASPDAINNSVSGNEPPSSSTSSRDVSSSPLVFADSLYFGSPSLASIGRASYNHTPGTDVSISITQPPSDQAPTPSFAAGVTSDVSSADISVGKTPWTADVLQALNSLLQTSGVGAEVPVDVADNYFESQLSSRDPNNLSNDAPVLGGLEPQVSHTNLSLDNEQRSPTPESREVRSPMAQIVSSSTRSLSALLDAYRSISDSTCSKDGNKTQFSASFLQCMTVPDGSTFAPGVTFVKCWKLINDGTCEWPEATEATFVGGSSLTGESLTSHVGSVKPGEWKDVWTTELKAPDRPGTYTSYWSLRDDKLQLFGPSIWVEIQVAEPGGANCNSDLTSSSIIIMPDISVETPTSAPPNANTVPTDHADDTDDDDVSDSSSVSMVSLPTSDDEDAALWEDSREHFTKEQASPAMEYVLLYDDNTSDED